MKNDSRPRNGDHSGFKHGEITQKVIGVFFEVYNELGHGFLESVYRKSLELALKSIGLNACRKIEIPVTFRGHNVGDFEADMLVEKSVLLELKTARALDSSHEAQLLNYLRATDLEVGLLLNFGLRPEFKRLIFDNPRKSIRGNPCLSVADLLTPE
jgi:GxxExxY protein